MIKQKFSVFDAVVYALKTVLDNFRLFFLAMLAYLGTMLVFLSLVLTPFYRLFSRLNIIYDGQDITNPQVITQLKEIFFSMLSTYAPVLIVAALIMFVVIIVLVFGFMKLVLTLHDTGSAKVSLLFSEINKFPKALGAWFLYLLMVGTGLLLLVVPGLYIMLRFMFFSYFIVDKNSSIIESFKQSWRITQGQLWPLLAIIIVITSLSVASGPFITLFSMPFITTTMVYVYRKLLEATPELMSSSEHGGHV